MLRIATVVGTLLLGVSAVLAQQNVAVEQDNLMRALGKSVYVSMLKMVKGDLPYDQAAVDAAMKQLEEDAPKIPKVFATNPKEDVVNATYGSSPKIWQNKADFDSKVPPVIKAIAEFKGKIKNTESLKLAYEAMNSKCRDCHESYRLKLK